VRSGRHERSTALASLTGVLASAAASWLVLRLGRRAAPALRRPWERTNHAGHPVTLLEGPAWVGGAVAGATAGAAAARLGNRPGRGSARSAVVVAIAAGALGALDDLAGGASDRGLKGHLGALARGEVTTGTVKIVGLGAAGLVGAALSDSGRARRPAMLATLVGGAVVAGAANAVNLFDLRPGRALKVTVAAGLPLVGGLPAAAAVGSSLGVVRDDLRATAMLGDTGANAAGALVGLALVERTGLAGRAVALAGLAALTIASERVSFTRVIEAHPALRRLDEWGRAPR
jgi:UDP-N-acetylmuramyl pentapeptide phosphotransferase/UDP-N-acetylglucosamine-1-phosphate transferase